jgi:signal transduction histidine kinase
MRKYDWSKSIWLKATAFILAVLLVPVIILYGLASWFAYDNGWWTGQPQEVHETTIVRNTVLDCMHNVVGILTYDGAFHVEELSSDPAFVDGDLTNFRFILYDKDGTTLIDTLSEDGIPMNIVTMDIIPWNGEILPDGAATASEGNMRIQGGIAKELKAKDPIYWSVWAAEYMMKIWKDAIVILGVALPMLIFLIIYLACASGRRPTTPDAVAGWQEHIPFDLYIVISGGCLVGLAALVVETINFNHIYELPLYVIFYAGLITAASVLILAFWMTLCARIKLGRPWQGTITFWVLSLCWRFIIWFFKWLFHILKVLATSCFYLISGIPLVWKTLLLITAISLIELVGVLSLQYDAEGMLLFWIFEKFILTIAAILCALQLKKLQSAGREMAAGNLNTKVDLRHMYWDFKKHGENLNDISLGIQAAVDKQLRSERLKTELITNVSHDIKTPLTSIINYVDLLKRDPQGKQAAEYLDVLDRQSHRLKKLTEDLVEVSKASTGNVEVNAARFNVKELLTQALGEYSERLDRAKLDTMLTLPEHDLYAWADGTLLWRVVDNLLSNACKYSLPGTRFYIDARKYAGHILISFKNISRDPLNVSPDELMERFVRGSAARTGEGSGLGLNIAKSLIELQGGSLSLNVDGDLFRVDITLNESSY